MAECTVPASLDNTTTGDNLYGPRACWQEFMDWAWSAYGFENDTWDDGFGYEDACNRNLPLNRTLAALWLLCYSAKDYDNDGYSGNCLHWARRYTSDQIDGLRSYCGDGAAVASAGWWDHVDLFLGYWYNQDVVVRASTLVHEARHVGGKGHNATFPAWSAYGPGKDGADSRWAYQGAWMYEVLYLWWFYADGRRTTQFLRNRARQEANFYIDNAFATHPGFTIEEIG